MLLLTIAGHAETHPSPKRFLKAKEGWRRRVPGPENDHVASTLTRTLAHTRDHNRLKGSVFWIPTTAGRQGSDFQNQTLNPPALQASAW